VGGFHPHEPGARCHIIRTYADRLSGFRLRRSRDSATKIGLDATTTAAETHREWGRKIAMDEDVIRKVTDKMVTTGTLPRQRKPILVRLKEAR